MVIYIKIDETKITNELSTIDTMILGTSKPELDKKNQINNTLLIRITEKCNNKCSFCSAHHQRQTGKVMSFGKIKSLIYSVKDNKNITTLEIGGAEPTTHPDFFRILRFANGKFERILVTTNARIFYYPKNVDRLSKIRGLEIKSSLHGHNHILHDYLTNTRGSFEQATKGFQNLVRCNIPLGVNIVITKSNIHHLKDIIDILSKIKIKTLYISGMIINGLPGQEFHAVELSKISLILPEVLTYAENKIRTICVEKLPICIAPNHAKYFLIESDKSHFTKFQECNSCLHLYSCMGIHKSYLNRGDHFRIRKINM